jgi:hypothetical protein
MCKFYDIDLNMLINMSILFFPFITSSGKQDSFKFSAPTINLEGYHIY